MQLLQAEVLQLLIALQAGVLRLDVQLKVLEVDPVKRDQRGLLYALGKLEVALQEHGCQGEPRSQPGEERRESSSTCRFAQQI